MTPLNYALLGMVRQQPRSGYALRKMFETTPLGNYSSSPGSIYPALKKLVVAGLLESQAMGRGNHYLITPQGERVLETWFAQPLGDEEGADMALMRFALLHDHPNRQLTLDFLQAFANNSRRQVASLKAFMDGDVWQQMSVQSRLAVQYGLRTAQASVDWADDALKQLKSAPTSS